jgi:ubiquinone/menaquinone biosynthesis C-methylase UbiE
MTASRPETLSPTNRDLDSIRSGFSAMAEEYDALSRTNPIVIWLRDRIREMVEREMPAGGSILEINCGSGLDASYFAAKGYRVHATDVAPGMLESLAVKAARPEVGERLTFENVSNAELDVLKSGPYDLVFSNLGGLNCIDDLTAVTRHLPGLLKPGGAVVLVVMPPVCPWEMLQAFRGHLGTAFRRFSRGGTEANIGGSKVRTWYHTPGSLAKALGPGFETRRLRSLSCFAPPSFFAGFAARHPKMLRRLMSLDDRLGARWPLSSVGDFYVLVSRRRLE